MSTYLGKSKGVDISIHELTDFDKCVVGGIVGCTDRILLNGNRVFLTHSPFGCYFIEELSPGETVEVTVISSDGHECTQIFTCPEDEIICSNCDDIEIDITITQEQDECCMVTMRTILPPDFNCEYDSNLHGIIRPGGSRIIFDVVDTGPDWTKIEVCPQGILDPNVFGTVTILNNLSVVCRVDIPFRLAGCL